MRVISTARTGRNTAAACLVPAWLLVTGAGAATTTDDWATYGHDKGGQRHSPLAQITPANVQHLQPVWTYHMRPDSPAPDAPRDPNAEAQRAAEGMSAPAAPPPGAPPSARRRSRFAGSQVTPLVVGGRMFVSTPYGRVVALDPASGRELWATAIPGPGQPSLRGVEYWAGDAAHAPRIVFGTRDGRLIALDAATGAFASGFGDNGVVDMKTPDVLQGAEARFYGMTSPPIVHGNLIITGSAVQEFPPRGTAGDVRAWDAVTGRLVWTFHSVPRAGEPGHDTWGPTGAERRSGVNVWGFLTVDAARGIVYMPFGAPAFDRYGGDRPGDNLYGTSLVAADARTGKYLWHFQVVRHDIWDNDLQAPPLLFDATVRGKKVPAVAIVSKNGLLFVLNRVTGKPIHPVAMRPVPASDVPGEIAAPTQPMPVVTPPLARTGFDPARDITDLTPQLHDACAAWIKRHDMVSGGLYHPVRLNRVTISFPGLQGGSNWGGAAYDPASRLLIVNTSDLGQVTALVPSTGALPYERGPVSGRFQLEGTRMLCQKGPWGRLSAVDMVTGRVRWQVPLGVTDEAPEGKQLTGRPNIGGAITTAGGLTFIGASDDGRFRAFDTRNGQMVWEVRLPAAAHATPITYAGADGRQIVAITSTGGSFLDSPLTSDTITAFALPTKGRRP
ncbi:PQQ-binding-like beta-propeller repeat protein [Novosphingobium sp. FSY-8]|uniref:PQQ-binding-like beta-propeller repeat protein n=1 Tax=Novosphingobium ovatum TaxID=1908523 RepID=A0ABW9XCE0_9SPHN|nr:pyrroloquinoline quinone-dependent dehydrogenase [Novosphingobium ovatum]NBC36183.1 PQQ-binding-like beta-propeller repeat protein [Novosphingobium ovatum]